MAIYSFNHDSFGKTTNRAGAAGDNAAYNARENETRLDKGKELLRAAADIAAYNAREEATYAVRSHIIPPGPKEAEAWFRSQEQGERKNARMSDRFIGALPRELTPDQCIEAVEKFCRDVTQDRVPWHFALHLELDKKNEPDWNPHVHIIFRDRDIETGRRYLYTSAGPKERAQLDAKGIDYWTTKDFREKWSADMNHALERAGHEVRIDHRSLKEQGIDREPQIHIGPGSQNAAKKGHEFESQDRHRADRTIPYSLLDSGSRAEHNARIVEGNKQPVASREHPEQLNLREAQAEVRRAMYREQKRDRDALRQAQKLQLDKHKEWANKLYADARNAAFEQVKEQTADRWKSVHAMPDKAQREQAAEALKREQQQLYAKVTTLHIGQARVEKDQAWQALNKEQGQERLDLRATHREEYAALTRQHTAERLGIAEKHRAQELQRDANRVAARLGGHLGMAGQQRAAVNIIRLKHNAGIAPGAEITPAEAIKAFMQTARDEHGKREKIREGLNARRQTDRLRGSTPDRFRAQARGAMDGLDPQTQARHAAASGRTLSSEERANAPQEIRERHDRQDKKAETEKFAPQSQPQQRGKDRGGGVRGR
ncbi:MAG: MobA/MobL family protein [Rhodomicrobium sp.]